MCLYLLNNKPMCGQSGMTLVVTLLLLLSLLMMASGITYITSNYANLSDSVTHKPLAIDAAETCIDQTLSLIKANEISPGEDNKVATKPIYSSGIIADTIPFGVLDTRDSALLNIAGKIKCNSVTIEKIPPNNEGDEADKGTYPGSDDPSIYRITATGLFNVPLQADNITVNNSLWQSSSSQARVEVVVKYSPKIK